MCIVNYNYTDLKRYYTNWDSLTNFGVVINVTTKKAANTPHIEINFSIRHKLKHMPNHFFWQFKYI